MRYKHADITKAREFLEDFGMHLAYREGKKLYYAGEGPDPFCYVAEEVSSSSSSAENRAKVGLTSEAVVPG